MIAMCMKCFEIFDRTVYDIQVPRNSDGLMEGMCPKLTCGGNLHIMDENIAPTIMTLNKKGYFTVASCGGHIWTNEHRPEINIYFHPDIKKISEKYIPEKFDIEWNEISDFDPVLKLFHILDTRLSVSDRSKHIYVNNERLFEWATKLSEYGG